MDYVLERAARGVRRMLIPMSRWSANHPIKLCLDHRVALAGDCFEPFASDTLAELEIPHSDRSRLRNLMHPGVTNCYQRRRGNNRWRRNHITTLKGPKVTVATDLTAGPVGSEVV